MSAGIPNPLRNPWARMEGKEVKEKEGDKQQEKNKAWIGIGVHGLGSRV